MDFFIGRKKYFVFAEPTDFKIFVAIKDIAASEKLHLQLYL